MSIKVTSKTGLIFVLEKDEFEIVKSRPQSLMKGKCFLLINANCHCYEITLDEFIKVTTQLYPDDVDAWEEAKHERR